MPRVRSAVHPGWVEVTGGGVLAVVAVADRHAEALATAAGEHGLLGLLDVLASRGLPVVPEFAAVVTAGSGARVVLRGAATVTLPDGTVLSAGGREPWLDLDVEVGDGEVVVAAPAPEVPRGWRRPAVLARGPGSGAADAVPPAPVPAPPAAPDDDVAPDAADRAEPDEGHDADAPGGPTMADKLSGARAEEPAEPEGARPDLTLPPPEDAPGTPPVDRVAPTPPAAGGVIDAVPWRRPAGSPAAEPPPPPPRYDTPQPAADRAAPAPVPERTPAPEPPTAAAEPEPVPGPPPAPDPQLTAVPVEEPADHPAPPAEVTTDRGSLPRSDEDLDRPVVLAVLCPAGHHSPPHAGSCRICGREIPPQQPFPAPRPPLGVLRISTGGVVPLDRGVLLGRAPRVNEELPPNQRPHLIRVGGVDRDISRNHAEVVLEGWHVLVRDLGSTNGTTVTLPGEEPVRLRPTEDHGIEPGTVITLADEVSLTYEVDA